MAGLKADSSAPSVLLLQGHSGLQEPRCLCRIHAAIPPRPLDQEVLTIMGMPLYAYDGTTIWT